MAFKKAHDFLLSGISQLSKRDHWIRHSQFMQRQLHVVERATITSGGEGLAALRYAQSIALAGCNVILCPDKYQLGTKVFPQAMNVLVTKL